MAGPAPTDFLNLRYAHEYEVTAYVRPPLSGRGDGTEPIVDHAPGILPTPDREYREHTFVRAHYHPGDTDLAWSRITSWRALLTAALDQPPHERITKAAVSGVADSASVDLLAGWLTSRLGLTVSRSTRDVPGATGGQRGPTRDGAGLPGSRPRAAG